MWLGTGRAFGTFGELVQGVLPERDRDFLVTFPVDSWTTATFHYGPESREIVVWPTTKWKARRLARMAIDALGHEGGGVLELVSDLPEGKGMASSSADLVATARAVTAAFGATFSQTTIESLMRPIEPSDGVMYDGIVAFYHREVRLHSRLGSLSPLAIIGHDEGGEVDTIAHSKVPLPFTATDKREYARLLAEIREAVGADDRREVGRISTRSTVMNSKLRPRKGFEEIQRACSEVDGLGLVMAHSGTMLGILLAGDDPELQDKTEYVRRCCAPLGGQVASYRSLSAPSVDLAGG
jgi:uncharacterized protein involved in propanediol utilization